MTLALLPVLGDSVPESDLDLLVRLKGRLDASMRGAWDANGRRRWGFLELDAYYDGLQRLEQLGLAVPEELRKFLTIVAWPGVYADSIEERCDVEGFRLPGEPEADKGLAEVWQINELDDESQMGHLDSLVFGRSYACVGTGEDPETPLITVESPLEMVHQWSPRDREASAAARFYQDDSLGEVEHRATLYTPDATTWLVERDQKWQVEDRDDHRLGRVPVVPLLNRPRTGSRYGVSQMVRVIGITDAAARALTNAQLATEVMALPQRWVAGVSQQDFTDPQTGEVLPQWEGHLGAIFAAAKADTKFGQFSAGDLSNFTKIVDHYGQLCAGLTGLPLRFFGQQTTNPPSAEGIRADEARLVKTCERKCRSWGASWERVMRLVRFFQTGEDDPALASMETLWRDPSTPTRAQMADSSVKLFQTGIISKRQARRDLGYSSVQIVNMERDDEDAAASDPLTIAAAQYRRGPDITAGEAIQAGQNDRQAQQGTDRVAS